MIYGSNTSLVEEVIALIENRRIFRPNRPVDAPSALVLVDLEEAKEYAWSRPIADDESPTWNDLREDQSAPLHALPYREPELKPVYDAVRGLLEPFVHSLEQTVPAPYLHLIEDVSADLRRCAMNRALCGLVENSFWEHVLRIYRQGAWPCGWKGPFPNGRIVIYQPPIGATS